MVAEPSTAIARRRRPRGQHPKRADQELAAKPLPQYLEAHEVNAIIRAADDPRARLLMLEQWRAGLRVSEALALEVADLSLDVELPTLRVRSGKGRKARVVPGASRTWRCVSDGACIRQRLRRSHYRRAPEHGMALGAEGGRESRATRSIAAGPRDRDSYIPPQLRSTSSDERNPDQLPVALARPQLDPDYAHIPGACAGPVRESVDGAVKPSILTRGIPCSS